MNLPNSQIITVAPLTQIFKSTSATYKFYWFYSILQAIEANKTETTQTELIASMVGNVWFSVAKYRLSFGKQDKLANIVDDILECDYSFLKFGEKAKQSEIVDGILRFLKQEPKSKLARNILKLGNYVPYRFLRPWCKNILKGVKDSQFEKVVKNYASGVDEQKDLPYFFENDKVIFNPKWLEYLKKHLRIYYDYCLWNLLEFLQKRNPNVPNIAEKLFPPNPKSRTLNEERKYWRIIYTEVETPLRCIFSDELINIDKYALDHFIPWSFVTHDLLWNLIPIVPSVNSSKSDNLPDLNTYFQEFGKLQYEAFHIWQQKGKKKKLEDYLVIGNSIEELSQLSKNDFILKLENQIKPLTQIAQNMGFQGNWIYQK